MEYYAGIDVSLESASLCVVDATGWIVREAKVASEPEVMIAWFRGLSFTVERIGLEAGPAGGRGGTLGVAQRPNGDRLTRPLAWLELAQMMSMFNACSARPNWVMPSPPSAPG